MTDTISKATKPVKDTVSGQQGGGDDGKKNIVSDTTNQATDTVKGTKDTVTDTAGKATDSLLK
ncbi:unnamed protein product [Debaryomyces tyrocola]|nr:unnamed protein product [Debaryomyces tyrocola]